MLRKGFNNQLYVDKQRENILKRIARFDGKHRVLESYISTNGGETYLLEQVIRRTEKKDVKLWRPIVPIHAQDNMPVYWHEGVYRAHTGGWHCDAVMFVEYDD